MMKKIGIHEKDDSMINQSNTENIGFDDHLSPLEVTVPLNGETTQENVIIEDHLPPFEYVQTPNFTWGRKSAEKVIITIDDIYEEIVYWIEEELVLNTIWKARKTFVTDVAHLFQYTDASVLEAVALKTVMIMTSLILQKPFRMSKSHAGSCLLYRAERRMVLWREGNFRERFEEGKTIQNCLSHNKNSRDVVFIAADDAWQIQGCNSFDIG